MIWLIRWLALIIYGSARSAFYKMPLEIFVSKSLKDRSIAVFPALTRFFNGSFTPNNGPFISSRDSLGHYPPSWLSCS